MIQEIIKLAEVNSPMLALTLLIIIMLVLAKKYDPNKGNREEINAIKEQMLTLETNHLEHIRADIENMRNDFNSVRKEFSELAQRVAYLEAKTNGRKKHG